jgi:GT2 family glycosyltransferase
MTIGRVLFFPEPPAAPAVINRILAAAGCSLELDLRARCDLAIAWDTQTFRIRPPQLVRLASRMAVWNLECDDVGKARVDRAFATVFGRTSLVDPLTHRGECVAKSNLNGAHDGVVVRCPLSAADRGSVYQRLVCNELDDGTVEDLRTPVFGDRIPLVYRKYRPLDSRFDQFETHVSIDDAAAVFSPEEQVQVVAVARALGMDYGELDVLRDRDSGELFVVDANPNPYGPPAALSPREQIAAIERMAEAFDALRGHARPSLSARFEKEKRTVHASAAPEVSVVVVARNEGDLVAATVEQLCDTLPEPNEILVVDDGSDDGSTDRWEAHSRVRLIRVSGLGVARGRNLGATRTTGRVLVFADAHLTIPDGWWEPLVAAVTPPEVGGASPVISNSTDPSLVGYGLRFTGFDLDVEWLPRLGSEPYPVPIMPWCFGAMRRDVFEATGGFDAGLLQWGSTDNEISVRLWSLGYELRIVPGLEVAHVFRDQRPYPIEWTPVLHNILRLAVVHFEPDRVARVVQALGHHPDFAAAMTRVVTSDAATRRREMASRRVRDSEWLFQDFATA